MRRSLSSASMKTSCIGQAVAKASLMRRTLTVTTAPMRRMRMGKNGLMGEEIVARLEVGSWDLEFGIYNPPMPTLLSLVSDLFFTVKKRSEQRESSAGMGEL